MRAAACAKARLFGYAPPAPVAFRFQSSFPDTANPYLPAGGLGGATTFTSWKDTRTTPGKSFATYIIQPSDDYLDSFILFDTGSVNHYVEIVISRSSPAYNAGDTHEVQCIVRGGGTSGSVTMWEAICEHQSTGTQLVHWDGALNSVTPDSYTTGTGSIGATPAHSDVFRMEASGNTLTTKWNGATLGTKSTSLYNTNTMAGYMFFPRFGSTPENFCIQSVDVGEL